ncbi:MAG: amidohydrolase family protein [Deltaproteobacteria bacterium]|nr:amidohydrolase family protein [Deltaproteobacteria bacterium]
MIIDAHAHVSREDYGNKEILLSQMKEAGVDKAILVPGGMIDVRKMTSYLLQRAQPKGEPIPNDVVDELIREHPGKFYSFHCVNPHHGQKAVEEFRQAIARGKKGLKLAPLIHRFSLTSDTVKDLAKACGELGVPFYTHVVFHPDASTEKVAVLAKEFPRTTIILGHMGLAPADDQAVECAFNHDNVFLESSVSSYLIVKEALQRLGPGKLIFGSEFPLYHPHLELEKIRILLKEDDFERVTSKNILAMLPS